MASSIEVFYLAKYLREEKSTHRHVLEHVLDECRHGTLFAKLGHPPTPYKKLTSPHKLLTIGGLDKSGTYRNSNVSDMCSCLYIGEKRAIEFLDAIDASALGDDIKEVLRAVKRDEAGHARGIESHLQKQPRMAVCLYKARHALAYRFSRLKGAKAVSAVRRAGEMLLVQTLARLITRNIANIVRPPISLSEALKSRKKLL